MSGRWTKMLPVADAAKGRASQIIPESCTSLKSQLGSKHKASRHCYLLLALDGDQFGIPRGYLSVPPGVKLPPPPSFKVGNREIQGQWIWTGLLSQHTKETGCLVYLPYRRRE